MNNIKFHDFSADFKNKNTDFINLNNGTLGLCPDRTIEAQIKHLKEYEINTTESLTHSFDHLWKIHKEIGYFFNCDPQDLFIRPNVTLSFNDLLMGLKIPSGSEILSTDFEYGAMKNCMKLKASNENLSYREISLSWIYDQPDTTDEDLVNFILSNIVPNTKIFVCSHVMTGNGLVMPIDFIGRRLKEKGIHFIVDGAHGPGLLKVDLKKELPNVDYYAGNLHKWIMGPKGTAFGYVNPRAQKTLHPVYGSWSVLEIMDHLKGFAPDNFFAHQFLWSHSQNFSGLFGIKETLDFWNHYGFEFINSQIMLREKYIKKNLQEAEMNHVFSGHTKLQYRFVSMILSGQERLKPELNKYSVPQYKDLQVGLPRLPGQSLIRLTPHIHNTREEIDEGISLLKQVFA